MITKFPRFSKTKWYISTCLLLLLLLSGTGAALAARSKATAMSSVTVKVHYARFDSTYTNWNLLDVACSLR